MPQLGETVTEGTVTKWLKAVGETIERDEPLFEVSTDKVDSEVPSPASGVLTEIRVPEGETVDVGALIAVVGDAVAASAAPAQPDAAPAAQASEPEEAAVSPSAAWPATASAPTQTTDPVAVSPASTPEPAPD